MTCTASPPVGRPALPVFTAHERRHATCRAAAVSTAPPDTRPEWSGSWLQAERIGRPLSVPAAAALAGISPADVRAAESDSDRQSPAVRALLAAYRLSVDDLRDRFATHLDHRLGERILRWVSARLRALRRARGVTVWALARRMGPRWREIVECERGGPMPSGSSMMLFGDALGLDGSAVFAYVGTFWRTGAHPWPSLEAVLATTTRPPGDSLRRRASSPNSGARPPRAAGVDSPPRRRGTRTGLGRPAAPGAVSRPLRGARRAGRRSPHPRRDS